MDKTFLRNAFIIIIILAFVGGFVTCAVINKDTITGLFHQNNSDFYTQPVPAPVETKSSFIGETALPTEAPTPEPTEEPTPIPTTEPTIEPTPEPTLEPLPEVIVTGGEEIIEDVQDDETQAAETSEPIETTEDNKDKEREPLMITITVPNKRAEVIVKQKLVHEGKYIDIEEKIENRTHTFIISAKGDAAIKTEVLFLYNDNRYDVPAYFYIYEITTSLDGKISGKLIGEYAYSEKENVYIELLNQYDYVYTGTVIMLLEPFGIKLIMPPSS